MPDDGQETIHGIHWFPDLYVVDLYRWLSLCNDRFTVQRPAPTAVDKSPLFIAVSPTDLADRCGTILASPEACVSSI
jgi:hypothetical protein